MQFSRPSRGCQNGESRAARTLITSLSMFFMSTSSRTPPLLTPPLTSLEVSKLHGVTAFSEEQEDVDEVWCARHHVAQHGLEISIKYMS